MKWIPSQRLPTHEILYTSISVHQHRLSEYRSAYFIPCRYSLPGRRFCSLQLPTAYYYLSSRGIYCRNLFHHNVQHLWWNISAYGNTPFTFLETSHASKLHNMQKKHLHGKHRLQKLFQSFQLGESLSSVLPDKIAALIVVFASHKDVMTRVGSEIIRWSITSMAGHSTHRMCWIAAIRTSCEYYSPWHQKPN